MLPGETEPGVPDDLDTRPAIRCRACQSALQSTGRAEVSFLLLEDLTVPVVGCDDHLEQFGSLCGFTTEDTAEVLAHQPAGGIVCPSCRLAPHNLQQPVIPVHGGAVAVLACPTHQAEIAGRFQTGLQAQQQITSSLDTS